MKKSLTKNYMYNTIYQLLVMITPLVTTPYISRVLGANNIGIYSYTISIATYFILFGSLGVALYGQREIAYNQNDKEKYSKTFFEIIIFRIITMSISMFLFYLIFINGNNEYTFYYKILIIELLGNALDISWFFQGQEDFKKTVLRNIVVKIISIISIFIFVKQESDLDKYFIIYVLSTLIGNLSLWFYLPQYINKVKMKNLRVLSHVKPTLALFIPQIAIQIYTVLDKVMIGTILIDKSEVGFYEQAQKVVKMLLTIVASLGTVMMPRIANSFANNEKEKIDNYMIKSVNATLILSMPLIFGVCVIAKDFVPIFFGNGYDKVIILIQVISPIILMIGLSGNIGTQYLLPTKQQIKFTTSVIMGALCNFIINIILIPKAGAIGASIGTVIAETVVAITQIIMTRKQFNYKKIFFMLIKYTIISFIMYVCCYLINFLHFNNIVSIILKLVVGVLVYGGILLVIKDKFVLSLLEKINIINKKKEDQI